MIRHPTDGSCLRRRLLRERRPLYATHSGIFAVKSKREEKNSYLFAAIPHCATFISINFFIEQTEYGDIEPCIIIRENTIHLFLGSLRTRRKIDVARNRRFNCSRNESGAVPFISTHNSRTRDLSVFRSRETVSRDWRVSIITEVTNVHVRRWIIDSFDSIFQGIVFFFSVLLSF